MATTLKDSSPEYQSELEPPDNKLGFDMKVLETLTDLRLAPGPGIWGTIRRERFVVLYGLLVCCGGLSEGYQTVLPSALVSNPGFVAQMGILRLGAGNTRALDPVHIHAWSGAYSAAYIVAFALAWWPVEKLGHKITLYAAQILFGIACTIEILARGWGAWLASRVLVGVAAALTQCAAINYLADISPTRIRGALLCLYPIMFAVGQFCAYIAVQVLIITGPFRYRRVLYAQYFFIGIAVAGLGMVPESPRWLSAKGKFLPARVSIQRLHIEGQDHNDEAIMHQLKSEVEGVRGEMGWQRVFQDSNLRRAFISSFCLVWSRWLGSSVCLGYFTYFSQLAGMIDPFTSHAVMNSIVIFGSLLSVCLVEMVGRRRLLLWSGTALIVLLLTMGAILSVPLTPETGGGLVFLSCLWTTVYSASMLPLSTVYLGESSTHRLRAKTISIAASGAAIVNLLADYCIPLALNNQHFDLSFACWLFSCTGLIGLVACYFYMPETANRSIIHLDQVFVQHTAARWFPTEMDGGTTYPHSASVPVAEA